MKGAARSLTRSKDIAGKAGRRLPDPHPFPGSLSSLSASAIGLLLMQPAMADVSCPPASSSTPTTCTVEYDQGGYTWQNVIVDFTGSNGSDENDGSPGGSYTVNNNALLGPSSPGIVVRLKGGNGSSDASDGTKAGAGGTIRITNNANISATQYDPVPGGLSGSAPGIWDDATTMFGIYGVSVGGMGGDADDTVFGGGDGGDGGRGSTVTIDNGANIQVEQMPYGGVGIYGASIGGDGGRQHSAAGGNQRGGFGGAVDVVTITNRGSVTLNASNVTGLAWGIAAEAIGGNGGVYNGNGGATNQSAPSLIQNSGIVQVTANGAAMSQGVRGLSMLSQGGNGIASNDGSDDGGIGGWFGQMSIVNSGQVSVTSDAVTPPNDLSVLSGGIVMIGRGGDGGDGPTDFFSNQRGGAGGGGVGSVNGKPVITVTLDKGSSIQTQGNYLPGVNLVAWGGDGGKGRNESSGGNGGFGGDVGVYMRDGAQVSTNGVQSHGIAARSYGGNGGVYVDSGGIVHFTSEQAGTGGAGGTVVITTGDASQGQDGGVIVTRGSNSFGILGQSMGGTGGATGYSFELIGNPGNDAGKGGASGTVNIDSRSAITTYGVSSHGIVAQAIGGGGGTAGASGGIVALGGSGGTGVAGGTVNVKQSGNAVVTAGSGAIGILGQSIGGGGGDAGSANGMAVIGGSGGGGGAGGKSTVQVSGQGVQTGGDHAHGVVAQAIGGGGGTGGAAYAVDVGVGFSMALAAGGTGGDGGAGGVATANISDARIVTTARGASDSDAHGVVVQSIGGGGGSGGASVARALAVAIPDPEVPFGMAISFSHGGTGGGGGAGSTASAALSNAMIETHGGNSHGVLIQSIGGGGGTGGSASATSTVIGTKETIGGSVHAAIGGSGGGGGSGGQASLTLQGSRIATAGEAANAILVQSVGGGGGSGGIGSGKARDVNTDASFSFTMEIGGTGSTGGNGGTASLSIDSASQVTTLGDGARAALVQSIGGGGGASQGGQVGVAFSGEGETGNSVDVSASVSVGRGGAGGGDGGAIALGSRGRITTYGADADGLLVQSVGGSGGLGGSVGGDSGREWPNPFDDEGTKYKFDVYVGGAGGAGGAGGNIGSSGKPAGLGGYVTTFGDYADGVVLQSIGGGGGAGGASSASSSLSSSELTLSVGGRGGSGGRGGTITAFLDGNGGNGFSTSGYGAIGIVMQSIGGGGGMAGSGSPRAHGKLSVGGRGNGADQGGDIIIIADSYADIQTQGDSAYGLVAQSIGGGGGIAMTGSTGAAANPGSQQFDLRVGNDGKAGGNGGTINVSTELYLNTFGDRAMGVVAQSIGGGGGIATSGPADGLGSVTLGSTQAGDVPATGGKVMLDLRGTLATRGAGAHGVVAQSIGGGGGIAGDTAQAIAFDAASFTPAAMGFLAANSQDVSVAVNGYLATSGTNAHGIVAQSIAGGGGLAGGSLGGFAGSIGSGGTAGNVSVTQSGTLDASGAGSAGIFAQSEGGDDHGTVNVVINGAVQGGSGSGAGVWVASGVNNRLQINAGASLGARSNVAARFDGKSNGVYGSTLTVDNYGTLKGDVICQNADGNTACQLDNQAGAVATDALAYDANVDNAGLIVSGRPGRFQTLRVAGDLTQSASGVLRADVDFDRMRSARMLVQGDADLAGWADVLPHALLPNRELTVLTVQGDMEGSLRAVDSAVFDYEARRVGRDVRMRVASADFDAPAMGLRANQRQVAGHLQRIWDAGGNSALAPLFAQLDIAARQGASSYRRSVTDLSPGVTIAPAAQSASNLGIFTSTMMSCPAFTGVDAMTGERDCFWGQATGRFTTQDGSKGVAGFNYDTTAYQFGGQREVSPGWFLGGSVAYESSRVRGSDGRVSGDGDSGYVGLVLKRQQGGWTLSAAIGGGYGAYRMDRRIGIPGYQDTLSSRPDVYGFNARLRAARTFAYDKAYVKPYVDLDASYTRMSGYNESGSNPLALSVDGSDQVILGVSPMVEIGGRAQLGNGAMLRPFLYAGVSLLSRDDWKSSARLRGAPAGMGTFDTSLPIDDVIGKVGAGLEVTQAGGMDFRLQYDGQFSEHVRSHSATLKVMVPF